MTDHELELERDSETIAEDVEIFEGAPDFNVSPALNVNETGIQDDDVDVEVQDA